MSWNTSPDKRKWAWRKLVSSGRTKIPGWTGSAASLAYSRFSLRTAGELADMAAIRINPTGAQMQQMNPSTRQRNHWQRGQYKGTKRRRTVRPQNTNKCARASPTCTPQTKDLSGTQICGCIPRMDHSTTCRCWSWKDGRVRRWRQREQQRKPSLRGEKNEHV